MLKLIDFGLARPAAAKGDERVVDALLQHGAESNLQASNGHTALTGAACIGHPTVVLRLLRAGADMPLRPAAGKTALQIANQRGHAECVAAVRTYLGEVTAARSKAPSAEAGELVPGVAQATDPAVQYMELQRPVL